MISNPTMEASTPTPSPMAPILNRTIPGTCHPLNQGTLTWGQDGLLAYGSHNMVVVVDPATVQVVQCLNKHRANVVVVDWVTSDTDRLKLASGDAAGQIVSWDLHAGEHLRQVHDGNLPVHQLRWVSSTSLLAVHPPNHLVLWDMVAGTKVWKKSYGDSILGFDLSPFHPDTVLLRCEHSFLTVTDFSLAKCPKSEGKKFYLVAGKGGSPGRGVEGTEQKMNNKSTKLRRMVRSMVLGDMGELEQQDKVNDCMSAVFHPGVKNQVVLAYSKEVLIVDTELGQTVGQINVDRSNSPLAGMEVARQKPVIFLLHESGSVSVWSLKNGLTVASTPIMMSKSQSLLSFPSTPASSMPPMDGLLEVSYESLTVSEHVRLGKNCRVLGLAVKPSTQAEVAFLTTDGRIFFLNLGSADSSTMDMPIVTLSSLSTSSMRLTVSAILSSLSPSKAVRMCPPLTTKNWGEYRPLLAVGTVTGHVQILNVSTGLVEREVAVHSAPVLGLEWTSTNPAASLLSFAYSSITGSSSGLVRNELVHMDIITGKVKHLRTEQGREAGEPKITMIRVSHLKKYFVVAFASGPFELWDLTKLCILRTMPKKFPHITALEWSPLHTARVKKSGSVSPCEKEGSKEQNTKEVTKEHIVLTDHDGQLYHFTVEGHTIKDGTKIPAETGLGTITCICWKSDMIVRGDTEGNVNIWNMKTRQSKNIHTGRGMVKRMSFSPGKNNMKIIVLYEDGVQIWDVKEMEMINELRSPLDMMKVEDVEWASSDRVVMAGQDGAVRLAGLALAGTSSHTLAYGREQTVACMALLPKDTFRGIACSLAYRPWAEGEDIRKVLTAGLTEEQMGLVEAMLDYLGEQFISSVSDGGVSLSERYLLVSLALGLMYETELWRVVVEQKAGRALSRQFHVLVDRDTFMARQEELSRLHMARAVEREDRVRLTAQLICLGQMEAAVSMLLDIDMEDNNSMADQLLACLIQATANRDTKECQLSHVSTMKMVATSLLSEGKLWEGVQLLVLTGKVGDACSYLRSAGHWDQALWLGRCRMDQEEWLGLAGRWADHLVQAGQVKKAAVVLQAVGSGVQALECLHVGQFRDLAHKMMPLLMEEGGINVDQVMEEAVMMETANLMSELGMKKAFEYYCEKLGRKGKELRLELGSKQ